MKHSETIEKLDTLQKAALVASGLDKESLDQAGLSAPCASLGAAAARSGVSYASAVRAWDPELVGKMTRELVAEAGADGTRLFVTPDLKVAVDPYKDGLAEDAFLCGTMGAQMVRAVHAAGGAAALSRLSLGKGEVAYLDRKEDPGAVRSLVAKPFLAAVQGEPCDAVFLTPNKLGSGYPGTNRALFFEALAGRYGEGAFLVGENTQPTAESLALLRPGVTLGGAKLPIERAAKRYEQLRKYCDEGSATERDLAETIREGAALETEKLDETADEIVDFCARLAEKTVEEPTGDEARRKLAEECIVLLKNQKLLPLAAGTKVAVLGTAYADLTKLGETFEVVGRAQGYEPATDRSEALIPEAVRLAATAGIALVFLTPDISGRALTLPANRIALLDALKKAGVKTVACVTCDLPVDLSFDAELASAALLLPPDGPFAGEALCRVLSGEVNPSGRLTRALHDKADEYYAAMRKDRDEGLLRMGGFVGYLRYVTAQEKVRYPFGYGLSYTKFTYSKLTVEGENISFTVKNAGKHDGTEVAQVYLGAPSASHVVPTRRLAGYTRIFLRAGESARVTVNVPDAEYADFDAEALTENVEAGTYRIEVGASATDIKLHGRRFLAGRTREKREESPSDYFRDGDRKSPAQVGRENRLGKAKAPAPAKLRAAKQAAICCMPVIAIAIFLLFAVLVLSYAFDYILFFAIDETTAEWVLYALVVLVLSIIPLVFALNRKRLARVRKAAITVCPALLFACFILGFLLAETDGGAVERISLYVISCVAIGLSVAAIVATLVEGELKKSKSGDNSWEKFYREAAPEETVTSKKAFEEAFLAVRKKEAKKGAVKTTRPAPEQPIIDVPQFYDKSLTYAVILRDCKQFVRERGLSVDDAAMRDLIAAITATQLIIVPRGENGDIVQLFSFVAEYLGKKPYVDNAEQYCRTEDLFSHWNQSDRTAVDTNFSAALDRATDESAFLHFVILRHADPNFLDRILGDVAEVLARRKVSIPLSEGDVLLPANLRIVAEVEADAVGELPEAIAETAAVLSFPVKAEKPVERKSVMQTVGYERFAALRTAVRDEFPLSEASWKSVDALDEKCRAARIGNLLWIKLERHASVETACGAGEKEALRSAVDAELYPWLSKTWDAELCGGELDETISGLFGSSAAAKPAEKAKPQTEKAKGGKKQ